MINRKYWSPIAISLILVSQLTDPISFDENSCDEDGGFYRCPDHLEDNQVDNPIRYGFMNTIINHIDNFEHLPANWDGEGGVAPSLLVIKNAVQLISSLKIPFQEYLLIENIRPSSYGTIILDWYNEEQSFLSVEIGKNKISFFSEMEDGDGPYADNLDVTGDVPVKLLTALDNLYNLILEEN